MKTNTYESFLFFPNYLFIHSSTPWNLISALLVLTNWDSTSDPRLVGHGQGIRPLGFALDMPLWASHLSC